MLSLLEGLKIIKCIMLRKWPSIYISTWVSMCSGKSPEAVSGCDSNSHFAFVTWKDVTALKKKTSLITNRSTKVQLLPHMCLRMYNQCVTNCTHDTKEKLQNLQMGWHPWYISQRVNYEKFRFTDDIMLIRLHVSPLSGQSFHSAECGILCTIYMHFHPALGASFITVFSTY